MSEKYKPKQAEQAGKPTIEGLKDEVDDQGKRISDTYNLMVLGFIVLAVMVAGIIISVILFEIQTINDSNQKTIELLQAIDAKHEASNPTPILAPTATPKSNGNE